MRVASVILGITSSKSLCASFSLTSMFRVFSKSMIFSVVDCKYSACILLSLSYSPIACSFRLLRVLDAAMRAFLSASSLCFNYLFDSMLLFRITLRALIISTWIKCACYSCYTPILLTMWRVCLQFKEGTKLSTSSEMTTGAIDSHSS